jgi:hypothetical protein
MAKIISNADGLVIRDMADAPRVRFAVAFGDWWAGMAIRMRALQIARDQTGTSYSAQDVADTKASLMAHFATQPDPANFT